MSISGKSSRSRGADARERDPPCQRPMNAKRQMHPSILDPKMVEPPISVPPCAGLRIRRQVRGMRHAFGVYELDDDLPALGMHGIGDGPPATDMLRREQPRNAGIADPLGDGEAASVTIRQAEACWA